MERPRPMKSPIFASGKTGGFVLGGVKKENLSRNEAERPLEMMKTSLMVSLPRSRCLKLSERLAQQQIQGQSSLQKKNGGNPNSEFGMPGFVTEGVHSRKAPKASA